MNSPAQPRLSRRRRLLYTLLLLGLLGLLSEGGARLLSERDPGTGPWMSPELVRLKILNGWVLTPGSMAMDDCLAYQRQVLRGPSPLAHGEVAINNLGLRDRMPVRPKPPGQRRILVLGDSSVYGAGLCRLDTLVERLEAALNPAGTTEATRAVEVWNGGVPGYSSYQSLELLDTLLPLGLDGIIVYSMVSDFGGYQGLSDDEWFGRLVPFIRPLARLALFRAGYRLVRSQPSSGRPQPREMARRNRVSISNYKANLRRFFDIANKNNIWLLYVIPPLRMDLLPPRGIGGTRPLDYGQARNPATRRYLDGMLEHAEGSGPGVEAPPEAYRAAMVLSALALNTPFVDGPSLVRRARAALPPGESGQPSLMLDDVHPGPVGQDLLAKALLPLIRTCLDRSPPSHIGPGGK